MAVVLLILLLSPLGAIGADSSPREKDAFEGEE